MREKEKRKIKKQKTMCVGYVWEKKRKKKKTTA